jgi:tripartite-type tricarboxylate transporter receptor subunit TctC
MRPTSLIFKVAVGAWAIAAPSLCFSDATGEISVREVRVLDKSGRGVRSKIYEVTREKRELLIDDTDIDGVLAKRFKCPQWHKVVAKPIAGRFTDSPHTTCAPKLVLTVWNVDAYPEASIRIIVPTGAGGSPDLVARQLARGLEAKWRRDVVVENKPGAGGNIGSAAVASAAPDGYTLLLGVSQTFTIYPSLYGKLSFDPRVDFVPVTMVASVPNVLVASPHAPFRSVKDAIDRAKANPGKLNFASLPPGSESHLAVAQFETITGTRIQHVPYKGSVPALASLMSGEVDLAFNALPLVLQNVRTGRVKALAIAGPTRARALPNVPTMGEEGVAGYEAKMWLGLFAPAGTPDQLVRKIQFEVASILSLNAFAEVLTSQGIEPVGSSSEAFASAINKDASNWAAVIKAAGIKPR